MNNEQEMSTVQQEVSDMLAKQTFVHTSAMADMQFKIAKVTTLLVNIVLWLVIGAVGSFAVWGITVGLELILKAWGLK